MEQVDRTSKGIQLDIEWHEFELLSGIPAGDKIYPIKRGHISMSVTTGLSTICPTFCNEKQDRVYVVLLIISVNETNHLIGLC